MCLSKASAGPLNSGVELKNKFAELSTDDDGEASLHWEEQRRLPGRGYRTV